MIIIKTLKSNISEQGIDNIIKKLKSLKSDLKQADINIVKDMSNFVKTEVENNIASTPYKDGNDDVSIYYKVEGNKAKVGMSGTQVLYNEFGTGTKGQESPHPEKEKFSLNGYNTGKKIKVSKTGEMFWIYRNNSGEIVKTQGIPAGKQVFNASIMLKGKKGQIIKRRVGEVISKL